MDRVIMFRPVRLSEIILQHCYFVGIRTTQLAKTPVSCTNQAARLDWGLLRKTTTSTTSLKNAMQHQKAELRTRIAKHLSSRVRPPDAALLPNMRISAGITDTLAPNQKTSGRTAFARTKCSFRTVYPVETF